MRRKVKEKHRLGLTLIVTGIVTCVTLATLLLVGLVFLLILNLETFTAQGQPPTSPIWFLVSFAASCFVVSAVITFFASKIPLSPVNHFIDYINRLAGGDYKARLQLSKLWRKHPTIAELYDSANRLAEELESTEMLRSDFINNFSHEFKTPIVSITGFAKLLRRGNLTPAEQAEYLTIVERESVRLSKMATNVLNLTRVENQTILTDVTSFNLSEQLRSCILLLEEKWEQKALEFSVEFGEYTIKANEELLRQIWINLLDNAIKFSPPGGVVSLGILEGEDTLSVSVTNTGAAISPENQKRVFNKFYQADESHAGEGNGIGLAIVKRVADLHGGVVSISCENGQTTFTVELPKAQ